MSDPDLNDVYEDTFLSQGVGFQSSRGYTIQDLQLMKAVVQWERPRYFEVFGPPLTTPIPPKPTLREHLLAEGFNVEKVDTYLEDRVLAAEDHEQRMAEIRAEQAKWQFRFRMWRRECRDRIRTASEVIRGQHECGY